METYIIKFPFFYNEFHKLYHYKRIGIRTFENRIGFKSFIEIRVIPQKIKP